MITVDELAESGECPCEICSSKDEKKKTVCPSCNQGITGFRDKLSQREHKTSGLCQECQDKTFEAYKHNSYPRLSTEAVEEFKVLYLKEFGIKLTNGEALNLGISLIRLVSVVYGANLPKQWIPKIDSDKKKGLG